MALFFATCPKDLEYLLVDELRELGVAKPRPALAGVEFETDLLTAQRACLWSRLANRVLMTLNSGPVEQADDAYRLALRIDWESYVPEQATIAVMANARHPAFKQDRFLALRVKDAVCDRFETIGRERPNVDLKQPDIPLYAYVDKKGARIGLDLCGRSLHERGYRQQAGKAPLRENIAAAVLLRSGWSTQMPESVFVDPMCGSGTLVIEAALMAADVAPGLVSARPFAFQNWSNFDAESWEQAFSAAEDRRTKGLDALTRRFYGRDINPGLIKMAKANAARAGLRDHVRFRTAGVEALIMEEEWQGKPGCIVTNPPYGVRIEAETRSTADLYRILGDRLHQSFSGWQLSVLAADTKLAHAIPFKPEKQYAIPNGPLNCKLINFTVPEAESEHDRSALSEAGEMLVNRLKKNQRKLKSLIKHDGLKIYRLYDADLPEFASAIDVYDGRLHIQEYAAPASIPENIARSRFSETIRAAQQAMDLDASDVYVKTRSRQRGKEQYEKTGLKSDGFWIEENGVRLKINLTDYLDTGVFADHRQTRNLIRQWADDGRFLNLFCYTASASIYAAKGGARETISVDLSKTYLSWAQDNFRENQLNPYHHRVIQANCLEWVKEEQSHFDLIFLDPPTFSNSKRMRDSFDVQRDHAELLRHCVKLLAPTGKLIFSTNARRFKLDQGLIDSLNIQDITHKTVPPDYQRRSPHQCWLIQH